MYVDTAYIKQKGKTYVRHLLRESYREDGKVKHRTIANLSRCSPQEIEAVKLALKHKKDLCLLGSVKEIKVSQGLRIGAVWLLSVLARRLGITQALGKTRQGKLALWQVMARLIDQGSRLSAVRLARSHGACEVLGLEVFNEDHLYSNLAWLADNQEETEQRLFKRHCGKEAPSLFLYDVTSSYLEGEHNALGAFGYNRDKKRGKKQLVIGLLTGPDGGPAAVRVFRGNTQDPRTLEEQIRVLANGFGVQEVTLVGDRGIIKGPQKELIGKHGFHYISAITKAQIRRLIHEEVLQMSLFDEDVKEVVEEGVRYILRRNPLRAEQVRGNRQEKLEVIRKLAQNKTRYLMEHSRAKVEIALRDIKNKVKKLEISKWVDVKTDDRGLYVEVDREALSQIEELDGCYVIATDLKVKDADTQVVHDRYKDLALVEHAFRTFKQGHLEVRPTFVRTKASTEGHVFVVMLAYMLERKLARLWHDLEVTVAEGLDELGALRCVKVDVRGTWVNKVPEPEGMTRRLLEAADVKLPVTLPVRKIDAATRKKLSHRRK
jgi:transposase